MGLKLFQDTAHLLLLHNVRLRKYLSLHNTALFLLHKLPFQKNLIRFLKLKFSLYPQGYTEPLKKLKYKSPAKILPKAVLRTLSIVFFCYFCTISTC